VEAVALFEPDLIIAPFLKRAIPQSIWSRHLVLIVHPGVVGDRGPSALDWAVSEGAATWGVTVLQAEAEMDAGPVWASADFAMRSANKASIYRNEVTEAALRAITQALAKLPAWRAGNWQPLPLAQIDNPPGRLRPLMRQDARRIDWQVDATATVLARIRAADGFPGVADMLFGHPCHLFDAHDGSGAPIDAGQAPAGAVVARCGPAVLRRTRDGAVWIGHVKRGDSPHPFKLPSTVAFADEVACLPERCTALFPANAADRPESARHDYAELRYRESEDGKVGFLSFDFYNGAMSTRQCRALAEALHQVAARPLRVLVLEGGRDFWSNGIHLNTIEAADSPADESWANINAMNDACLAILGMTDRLTIAALRGNAGAGGCFLALAADRVWAREGVILNPHYRNMGNLYGSEYWTYLLPARVGDEMAGTIMRDRLPLLAGRAADMKLIDACFGADQEAFAADVARRARRLAADPQYDRLIAEKASRRAGDDAQKPLAQYREAELDAMRRNFYGFDPSYHVARYHFVLKSAQSWTPRHLARHRDLGWRRPDVASEGPERHQSNRA